MEKIKSWDELKKYRADNVSRSGGEHTVLAVGMATCGVAAGARDVAKTLEDEIARQGLENVSVMATGCYGFCYAEPMVEVRVPGKPAVRYGYVDAALARDIVHRHLARGEILTKYVLTQEVERP